MTMSEPHASLEEPLRLVHHHPGRLRVRAQAFVGAPDAHPAVQAAQATALATPGVLRFSHSQETGSLVIDYRPGELDVDALIMRMATAAGLRGIAHDNTDRIHRKDLVTGLIDTVKGINQFVHEVSDGRADLRELLPAALAATSLLSFLRNTDGSRLPRWDNALFWCQSLFLEWHRQEIDTQKRESVLPKGAERSSNEKPR